MSLDLCSNKYGYLIPKEKALEAKEEELIQVVKLLIEKGADASIPNSNGETVLELATQAGLEKLSEVLRDKK